MYTSPLVIVNLIVAPKVEQLSALFDQLIQNRQTLVAVKCLFSIKPLQSTNSEKPKLPKCFFSNDELEFNSSTIVFL